MNRIESWKIPGSIYTVVLQNRRAERGRVCVCAVIFPINEVVGLLRVISRRRWWWFIVFSNDEKDYILAPTDTKVRNRDYKNTKKKKK